MGLMGRDILDRVAELKAAGQPFALATVVRTVAVTAAKAGAKAVIRPDGTISEGWIGGGCARGAVLRAAKDALADGQPRLISVSPEDVLTGQGVAPGQVRDGVRYARSMCPSRGTMDIFIEPVMPRPEVIILGTSPVGLAVADLAPRFGFDVTGCAIGPDLDAFPIHAKRIDGFALPGSARGYVLVATQGRGDEAALRAALAVPFVWTAFVGSRAKMAALRDRLADADPARLAAVEAPAGLDIGAITPDEIALSILARMVAHRRQGQRG
jgi:xanthine dehydrogenase accessory factor